MSAAGWTAHTYRLAASLRFVAAARKFQPTDHGERRARQHGAACCGHGVVICGDFRAGVEAIDGARRCHRHTRCRPGGDWYGLAGRGSKHGGVVSASNSSVVHASHRRVLRASRSGRITVSGNGSDSVRARAWRGASSAGDACWLARISRNRFTQCRSENVPVWRLAGRGLRWIDTTGLRPRVKGNKINVYCGSTNPLLSISLRIGWPWSAGKVWVDRRNLTSTYTYLPDHKDVASRERTWHIDLNRLRGNPR